MKRRYKPGDWFVVPLPSGRAATGIIARASASRLFGYIFGGVIPRERLHELRPGGELFCGLFSARGIEDHRWRLFATSLPFDAVQWPLPAFHLREPFARRWARRTVDEATLAPLETTPAPQSDVAALPDARIFEAEHVERVLDARLDGASTADALIIVDLHPPLHRDRLLALPQNARLQVGSPLGHEDSAVLADVLAARPHMRLRFYGAVDPPALVALFARLPTLRALELDVALKSAALLAPLRALREVRLNRAENADLSGLHEHADLQTLWVRGVPRALETLARLPALRELHAIATGSATLAPFAEMRALEVLELAYQPLQELTAARSMRGLRALTLRYCNGLASLCDLESLPLRVLTIDGLAGVANLDVLPTLPELHSLTIRNMPHLNVPQLRVLAECRSLRALSVDLGSRSKNREVYRLSLSHG